MKSLIIIITALILFGLQMYISHKHKKRVTQQSEAEHTLIYFIQLNLVEYVNIFPGDALATDFLKITIN